jgi:hypothetical protein
LPIAYFIIVYCPLLFTFAEMFRKITATLLLMAFVAQTFSAPFIRLDYFFNQTDYARNCVNKATPMLHCNGHCQMMKKIREEEKKEQETQERKMGSKVEVLSSRSFYTSVSEQFSTIISHHYFTINDAAAVGMPRTVFHPPAA